MSKEVEVRKSVVTLGIKRSLNTAPYENLELTLNIQDEITWTTPSERSKKIENLQTILNSEFERTEHKALADLGIQEKRAWFKQSPTAQAAVTAPRSAAGDDLLD